MKEDKSATSSLCVHSGAVIFDLNASSLSAVAEKVADELVNKDEIRPSDRDALLRALLMRRRYPMRVFFSSFSLSQTALVYLHYANNDADLF